MKKPETQYLKATPLAVKAGVISPKVRARTDLARRMYEIAEEHKDLAKQVTGRNLNIDMPIEIKESMISIVFAYTCLEAYINTIGRDQLDWSSEKLKKESIAKKWKDIAKGLAEKRTGDEKDIFNEDEEPFNSFRKLKKLREELIIHYKAEFNDIEDTKYGRTEGLINSLCSEKAEWACSVVQAMITKLHDATGTLKPTWLKSEHQS